MTVLTLFLLWSLGCVTVGIVVGVVLTISVYEKNKLKEARARISQDSMTDTKETK
jgi:hypothetical protein